MTFPAQAMLIKVELQVGVGGTWVDVTEDLRMANGVSITRGRQDEASDVNPGQCVITLNNRHGKYSEFNPLGPYYGRLTKNTPMRVSVAPYGDGVYYPRFAGEVSKWPPRWDVSDTDVWVPIEAAGLLRRLRANSDKPASAHRRLIEQFEPFTYWPMSEGEDAREAAAAFGIAPLRPIGGLGGALFAGQPEWGDGEFAQWLEPAPLFVVDRLLVARFPTRSFSDPWSVEWVHHGTEYSSTLFRLIYDLANSEFSSAIDVQVFSTVEAAGAVTVTYETTGVGGDLQFPIDTTVSGHDEAGPHLFRFTFTPVSSTSVTVTGYLDGVQFAQGTTPTNEYLKPLSLELNGFGDRGIGTEGNLVIGHVVFYGSDAPEPIDSYRAMIGHQNEKSGRRIERLCQESGISIEIQGDPDLTQACGPQQLASRMDLLQAAADVDGGALGESIEDLALLYRTQRSRYNQGEVL